jgi:integrase
MVTQLLEEFRLDWRLSGRAHRTVDMYINDIVKFLDSSPQVTMTEAKAWLMSTDSPTVRRKRGQALRAFGSWCRQNGIEELLWMCSVPLAIEPVNPQLTVCESDYLAALKAVTTIRDRAAIELLWSCGLRRGELSALNAGDVDLVGGFVVVRKSKTGQPRIAPLSPSASQAVRKLLRGHPGGVLLGMSSNAIRLMLQRIGAPSAHAWRRGWAVRSLRSGVSETSLKAAAGWSSGAMVSRYTNALRDEVAIEEFSRSWMIFPNPQR